MTTAVLPWHAPAWDAVLAQYHQQRLPHALLICAPPGTGGELFAEQLAACMICSGDVDRRAACGNCQDCYLFAQEAHADCMKLRPEAAGKAIPVDAVRAIGGFAAQGGLRRDVSVVLLHPAEALNHYAANALLKTLEEPREGVHLLLATTAPGRLLATLRSRCQRLVLPAPKPAQALQYVAEQSPAGTDAALLLSLVGGAPLHALKLLEGDGLPERQRFVKAVSELESGRSSVVRVARAAAGLALDEVLDVLYLRLAERQRQQSGAGRGQVLFRAFDQLLEARRAVLFAGNPNRDLLLESLLLAWPKAKDDLSAGGMRAQAL